MPRLPRHTPWGSRKTIPPSPSRKRITRSKRSSARCGWPATRGCLRAPLFPQLSVGVPLGGGVLAVLDEVARSIDPRSPSAAQLRAAMRFGWEVARRFVAVMTGSNPSVEDVQALTPGRAVVMVAEVMALPFVQLSGILRYRGNLKGL